MRIGNYLNHIGYYFHEDEIIPDGTYDLHIVDIETLMFLEGKMNYYTKSGFQPIPITEEWLLKFGFKRFSKDFSIKGLILHRRIRGFVVRKTIPEIKFVHQLQNLYFALTGKELKYDSNM